MARMSDPYICKRSDQWPVGGSNRATILLRYNLTSSLLSGLTVTSILMTCPVRLRLYSLAWFVSSSVSLCSRCFLHPTGCRLSTLNWRHRDVGIDGYIGHIEFNLFHHLAGMFKLFLCFTRESNDNIRKNGCSGNILLTARMITI